MKIYNTLTREKEEFVPLEAGKASIYVCGPTVYNFFHLGNARPFIVFDTLRRYLEYKGYDVTYVQNFTDIDDKMIKTANENGISVKELGDRCIKEYFVDARGLGVKEASIHPRATECISDIIELVKNLIEAGFAYNVNGDVYFSTKQFKTYGKLSKHSFDELKPGARVTEDDRKRDTSDFAVWKAQKPGEPAWESPWGMGRPGWHIECSAMVMKYIGRSIDIHCGGQDLLFPHHENEIAQSEAVTGKPLAKYWMHNGFINIDNEKMSKSLGNFFTVRDIVKRFDYEVIRFFMLSAHYRSPINFADTLLEQAKNGLERIYNCISNLQFIGAHLSNEGQELNMSVKLAEYKEKFVRAMDDDINTADAIAAIFEGIREINANITMEKQVSLADINDSIVFVKELCGILGIAQKNDKEIDGDIEALIEKRQKARADKNYQLADEIRDQLKEMGIVLEDTPQGVKWKRS